MSLFGSKKAEYEYVSVYIEVAGFEIGDYSVDLSGFGYEEIEIVGNLYEIRAESKSSVGNGRVSVEFTCSNFSVSPVTLGHFIPPDSKNDFAAPGFTLTPVAQNALANELRWRHPKFLAIEGRREKGAQGLFDVLSFRLSQERTGRL